MEEDSILRQHNKALDQSLAGVMPDKWAGHGRLLIQEEDTLSAEQKDRAIEALENLSRKERQHFEKFGAERVANKVIEKISE